jgi:hypothetical protein
VLVEHAMLPHTSAFTITLPPLVRFFQRQCRAFAYVVHKACSIASLDTDAHHSFIHSFVRSFIQHDLCTSSCWRSVFPLATITAWLHSTALQQFKRTCNACIERNGASGPLHTLYRPCRCRCRHPHGIFAAVWRPQVAKQGVAASQSLAPTRLQSKSMCMNVCLCPEMFYECVRPA